MLKKPNESNTIQYTNQKERRKKNRERTHTQQPKEKRIYTRPNRISLNTKHLQIHIRFGVCFVLDLENFFPEKILK